MNLTQFAEQTLMASTLAARLTPIAWVVEATFINAQDEVQKTIVVALSPTRPDAEKHIPEGAELVRDVTFAASQLADMADHTRERHRPHFRAFLMWNAAQAAGKAVADLTPWVDYAPDSIDDAVTAWSRPIPMRRQA